MSENRMQYQFTKPVFNSTPVKHNFNAGPGSLPRSVMQEVQNNIIDFKGLGIGPLEMSHRSKEF